MGRKPQNSANLAAFLHIIDTSRLLDIIREDSRAILRAASAASKAADYLLAFRPEAALAANDDDPDPDPDCSMALAGRAAA